MLDRLPHGGDARSEQPVHEWRLLLVVFVVGLLLRILFLGSIPNTATADELDFAGNALQVMAGQGPGLFGLDWTPEPALDLHFIVGSWSLLGETLFAERLVAAVLTALAVFPFYALVRRLVGVNSALAATALFASARWLLLFGRSGWNNGDVILFMLLSAWSLTLALERRQVRYWLGLGAGLALLLYGYFAGRAVVAGFALYLGLQLWARWGAKDRPGLRRVAGGTAIAAVTCVVLFFPEVPAIVQHWQIFNRRTSAVYVLAQPLPAGETPATLLAGKTWTAARSFLFMDPTVDSAPAPGISAQEARYIPPGVSWLDPVAASLYVVGLILGWRRGGALTLWWCLLLVPLALTQVLSIGTPDGARALPAIAPMYVFVALTFHEIGRRLPRLRHAGRYVVLPAVLAVALIGAYNVRSYVQWVDSPAAVAARQPGVPVSDFPTWRDFQIARLQAHLGIMPAGEYDQLPSSVIAAQIAGLPASVGTQQGTPSERPTGVLPTTPAVNAPPDQRMARQVATIGTPGAGPGQLSQPRDVAVDGQGNLYVVDTTRDKVVVYASNGHFLDEWAPAGTAQPFLPWAIAAAPDGTLYVLDARSGAVGHYDTHGDLLGIAPLPSPVGSSRGLTRGPDGVFFVAQTPANRVARFTATGPPLPPLSSSAVFNQPTSAVATSGGAVFVYEPDSGLLQIIASGGHLVFTVPAPRVDTVGAGRLAVLPGGQVLLADAAGRLVLVYASNGRLLGSFPVDGVPQGLAVTPDGTVAVADVQSKRVRLYVLAR